MRPLRSFSALSGGFTLLELLVAMLLSSLLLTMVVGTVMQICDTYYTDIKRTEMNSNLRSALDVMSMNVRQAGENLLAHFPATLLTNGTDGASDTLILRRALITEVLTICTDAVASSSTLYVSSATPLNSSCVAANVGPVFNIFTGELATLDWGPRIFIYDKVSKTGEFINYVSSGTQSGQYYLTVSSTSRAYTALNSAVYIVEEFMFSHNAETNRLELRINGENTPRPVAFDIAGFQAAFIMEDGSTLSGFDMSGDDDWKDIHGILLTLSGRNTYKSQVITSTISSRFFPRNVLSYEG